MKREFLEGLDLGEGIKLSKAAIEAIMAENGRDVEAKNNSITQLQTERDGLKGQLEAASAEIKSYKDLDVEGIKAKAAEFESKYNTETQALREQLEAANYGFAVKDAIAPYKFSSESARKAFVADLTAKKLPLQEGKLLGLEDFHKQYAEADPGAFVTEEDGRKPIFAKATGGAFPPAGGFSFDFPGVRAKTNKGE